MDAHVQQGRRGNFAEMNQPFVKRSERPASASTVAARRRRSVRAADSAVVVGLVVSYFTSSVVTLHAIVSLLWAAAVGWHFWLHRKWFKSLARRLSKKRSWRSRSSAYATVVIAVELTAVVAFGIAAWLGPRGLKGLHGTLGNILLAIAAIHIASNIRQLKALVRRRTTVIDPRFRGSADSAQGGYAAGTAVSDVEGIFKVELREPVPVEQELLVDTDAEEQVTVFHGADVIMTAHPEPELDIEIPASAEVIAEIFTRGAQKPTHAQQRSQCFGCSSQRADGLGINPAPVGTTGIWGTTWTPGASLPSADGFVKPEVVWAALDCPGSFAAADPAGRPPGIAGSPALEEMTVEIRDKVRVGEQLVVLGWTLTHSDSGVDCGTAIVDRAGHIKAYARLCHSISVSNKLHGQ